MQKATAANYASRRGTYDFGIYPVTFPPDFFIFDRAVKQNVSFMDYGEQVGAAPRAQPPGVHPGSSSTCSSRTRTTC